MSLCFPLINWWQVELIKLTYLCNLFIKYTRFSFFLRSFTALYNNGKGNRWIMKVWIEFIFYFNLRILFYSISYVQVLKSCLVLPKQMDLFRVWWFPNLKCELISTAKAASLCFQCIHDSLKVCVMESVYKNAVYKKLSIKCCL